MVYNIKLWDGSPEEGILLARVKCEAANQMQAIQRFVLPAVALLGIEIEEFSFLVEPFTSGQH